MLLNGKAIRALIVSLAIFASLAIWFFAWPHRAGADGATANSPFTFTMKAPTNVTAGMAAPYEAIVTNISSRSINAQVVVTLVSDGGPQVAYADKPLVISGLGQQTWNTGWIKPGGSAKMKIGFQVPVGPNNSFCAGLTAYSKFAGTASETTIPCSPVSG